MAAGRDICHLTATSAGPRGCNLDVASPMREQQNNISRHLVDQEYGEPSQPTPAL